MRKELCHAARPCGFWGEHWDKVTLANDWRVRLRHTVGHCECISPRSPHRVRLFLQESLPLSLVLWCNACPWPTSCNKHEPSLDELILSQGFREHDCANNLQILNSSPASHLSMASYRHFNLSISTAHPPQTYAPNLSSCGLSTVTYTSMFLVTQSWDHHQPPKPLSESLLFSSPTTVLPSAATVKNLPAGAGDARHAGSSSGWENPVE